MNTEIQSLQQQIQQLQQQLQNLQIQVQKQAQQPPAPAPVATAPAAPTLAPGTTPAYAVQTSGNRFGIQSASGDYSLYLTGRLHLDIGGYPGFHTDSKGTAPTDLNAGENVRRGRLGVTGKFAGDWGYTFIYDFGGSGDNGPASPNTGPAAAASGGLENAFITYNGFYHGAVPIAFDAGYQDTPFTLDEATSSNDIMFMERASSQVVATEFDAGDFRSAVDVRSNNDRYWAGLYLTGPVSGSNHAIATGGEPYGIFARATYQVMTGPDYSLHVGANVADLLHPATATATSNDNPLLALSDRPELRIDPTTFLSTTLGATAAGAPHGEVTGGQVYGVEAAAGWQNLFLQSEGYNYVVNRRGMPDDNFWGGYVEGSVTLTGEHRNYIPATGAYSGIIPAHPFSVSAGTWGAFELAARLSYINLDDNFNGAANGTSALTNSAAGGRQTIYGLGLNWYLNPNIRMMFNYLHAIVDKNSGAATNGEIGATIDEVAGRVQVAF